MGWATEIQVERVVCGTQVVQLKDELLGEILCTAPDDPSYTNSTHTVLVARGVDTEM